MTDRLKCVVPFCRHTTSRTGFDEWICGEHWRAIDKPARRYATHGLEDHGPSCALTNAYREGVARRFGILLHVLRPGAKH